MLQILLAIISIIVGITVYPETTNASLLNPCTLSRAEKNLDKDQRDAVRMQCLKKKRSSISVSACERIANSFEYSKNADIGRLACLFDSKYRPTIKECVRISSAIQSADLGDEARWSCIKDYAYYLSVKECKKIASAMAYPTNKDRANYYCSNELRNSR